MSGTPRSTLVVVENLSVPFDRRVWQECLSLHRAGWDVTVICPHGSKRDREPYVELDGVAIHRYPLQAATGGPTGYLREYSSALWHTRRLARRLARRRHFDVVHICNPPDVLFLAVRFLKRRGTRTVFDQHDLVPELYLSRFSRGQDVLYRVTRLLERLTYGWADVVISTNESYRRVALGRGRKEPGDVFVVRSGPDLQRFRLDASAAARKSDSKVLAYLGVMGPQDGIDHALRALATLARTRSDWRAYFIGDGDVREQMVQLADELGLAELVEFTGRLPDEDVLRIVGGADVCLAPDPKNPLNDVSTMNKIVEYMALGRPVVSYDLVEARVSAAGAALYARPNDTDDFARQIDLLLSDPAKRQELGAVGLERVRTELSWAHSEPHLLAAYERALGRGRRPQGAATAAADAGRSPADALSGIKTAP
jgi:glycosyltransferase involved in cell wall biosynthesis